MVRKNKNEFQISSSSAGKNVLFVGLVRGEGPDGNTNNHILQQWLQLLRTHNALNFWWIDQYVKKKDKSKKYLVKCSVSVYTLNITFKITVFYNIFAVPALLASTMLNSTHTSSPVLVSIYAGAHSIVCNQRLLACILFMHDLNFSSTFWITEPWKYRYTQYMHTGLYSTCICVHVNV